MINSIGLQNIRAFRGKIHSFPLAQLTAFTGSNSSGKSTILKMLQLLRQTHGIKEPGAGDEPLLRLSGTQVDLGSYKSLVSDNNEEMEMGIAIGVTALIKKGYLQWLRSLQIKDGNEFYWNEAEDNELKQYNLECYFRFSTPPLPTSSGTLKLATFSLKYEEKDLLTWRVWRASPNNTSIYIISLPSFFTEALDLSSKFLPISDKTPNSDLFGAVDYITAMRGILPNAIIATKPPNSESSKISKTTAQPEGKPDYHKWPIPPIISDCFDDLDTALTEISYVGPLRPAGGRIYFAKGDAAQALDPSGTDLPLTLSERREEQVVNFHLEGGGKVVEESLMSALSYWLKYFRLGNIEGRPLEQSEIDLSKGDVIIEFKLQSPESENKYYLADSGFGYSQIMPVLVSGLLTKKDGTLVVEQPELHLHPALQVRLASFFLAMVQSGRQVLIETHSEHLVNALRVLIAEKGDIEFAASCKIYYLDLKSNGLAIHDLSIGTDGMLTEWPNSFFGDALELSARLLRAQQKFIPKG